MTKEKVKIESAVITDGEQVEQVVNPTIYDILEFATEETPSPDPAAAMEDLRQKIALVKVNRAIEAAAEMQKIIDAYERIGELSREYSFNVPLRQIYAKWKNTQRPAIVYNIKRLTPSDAK
jgi:hypothetical protein